MIFFYGNTIQGFLILQIPATLIEKRITPSSLRRSAALGLFVASVRGLGALARFLESHAVMRFLSRGSPIVSFLWSHFTADVMDLLKKYKNMLIGLLACIVALSVDGMKPDNILA